MRSGFDYPRRWWTFVRERFEPVSHLLMLGVFFLAHVYWVYYVDLVRQTLATPIGMKTAVILFVGVVTFFFKLRLYDEIKDYQTDLLHNPTRPLARGLLSKRDLYLGIAACILVENVIFFGLGRGAWLTYLVALGYSLLMFKEFFIGDLIRPHLTTYAVSHTFVSVLVSLSIYAVFWRLPAWQLPSELLLAALSSWCAFNIFEFARKTFAPGEERQNVESYSKVFGGIGAGVLVVVMGALALALVYVSTSGTATRLYLIQSALIVILSVAALASGILKSVAAAKAYRRVGSLYIVLFYLAVSESLSRMVG